MAIETNKNAKNILGQLISQGTNPLQQGVIKAVQKKQAKQVEEAMDAGVPAEEILKQVGVPLSEKEAVQSIQSPDSPLELVSDERNNSQPDQLTQQASKLKQSEANEMAIKAQSPQEKNILVRLFQAAGFRESGANQLAREQARTLRLQNNSPQVRGLDQEKIIDLSVKLADRFDKDKDVAEFNSIRNQVGAMDSLFNNSLQGNLESKIALDQALITTFNKVLDPISVVRESEFRTTAGGAAFENRVKGSIKKLRDGGQALTDLERSELVKAAKIIANERGKSFNRSFNKFKKRVDSASLDKDIVFGGVDEFELFKIEKAQQSNPKPFEKGDVGKLKSGVTFTIE